MIKKSLQILFCFFLLTSAETFAQKKDKKNKKNLPPAAAEAKKPDAKKEPKPYKKVIDSTAVTQKGLIDVHKVADKYLFEFKWQKWMPFDVMKGESHLSKKYIWRNCSYFLACNYKPNLGYNCMPNIKRTDLWNIILACNYKAEKLYKRMKTYLIFFANIFLLALKIKNLIPIEIQVAQKK